MNKRLIRVGLLIIGLMILVVTAFTVINIASRPSRNIVSLRESILEENASEQSSNSASSEVSSSTSESLSVASSTQSSDEVKRPSAQKAPEATILDKDGQTLSILTKIGQGKPVILNVWASWCPPCRAEMPYFESAYQQYKDQVEFVMVNATNSRPNETMEVAMQFMQENGYTMPTYFDSDFSVSSQYFVSVLPMTFLIDGEGNITKINRGGLTEEALQSGIDSLLATNE